MTLLKDKELTELLGVHRITLQKWRKKGLPFIKTPTGLLRYDKDAVMEWLNGANQKEE